MKNNFFVYFIKSYLIIYGLNGRIIINLKNKVFNSILFLKNSDLFFIEFDKKLIHQSFSSLFKKSFLGVNGCFSKKINLIGIGFRCWVVYENSQKFLVVKTSLSKDCIFYVPKTIDIFCLSSTTIFVKSIRKFDIDLFVSLIKKIKKPNFYKQKGIFLENEIIKVKKGKKM